MLMDVSIDYYVVRQQASAMLQAIFGCSIEKIRGKNEILRFKTQMSPVVAAEETGMVIIFANAKKIDNSVVFANSVFLRLRASTDPKRLTSASASDAKHSATAVKLPLCADIDQAIIRNKGLRPEIERPAS